MRTLTLKLALSAAVMMAASGTAFAQTSDVDTNRLINSVGNLAGVDYGTQSDVNNGLNAVNNLQNGGNVQGSVDSLARIAGVDYGTRGDVNSAMNIVNNVQNGGNVQSILNDAANISGMGYGTSRDINSALSMLNTVQNGGSTTDIMANAANMLGGNSGGTVGDVGNVLGALGAFGGGGSSSTSAGDGNIGNLLGGLGGSSSGPKKFKEKHVRKFVEKSSGMTKEQFEIRNLTRSDAGTSYQIHVLASGATLNCTLAASATTVGDSNCAQ